MGKLWLKGCYHAYFVQSSHTFLLCDNDIHIFVEIKTIGVVSLKIWNTTVRLFGQ